MSSKISEFLFGQRRELSTSSTDPFNLDVFPEEIQEVILSFLPFPDLINATLVSRFWNIAVITEVFIANRQL